jgi:hypothetical protein
VAGCEGPWRWLAAAAAEPFCWENKALCGIPFEAFNSGWVMVGEGGRCVCPVSSADACTLDCRLFGCLAAASASCGGCGVGCPDTTNACWCCPCLAPCKSTTSDVSDPALLRLEDFPAVQEAKCRKRASMPACHQPVPPPVYIIACGDTTAFPWSPSTNADE